MKGNRVSRADGRDGSCSWNAVWLRGTARERKQRPHTLQPVIFSDTLLMKCSSVVCVCVCVAWNQKKALKKFRGNSNDSTLNKPTVVNKQTV